MARTIIVLGMHRSGTSALAGSLEEAGVYLGDVSRKAPYNAKGNRENRTIMVLQERLLRANGGSWFDPPERVRWSWRHRWVRRSVIRRYAGRPIWGFKDPRSLFTLEGWLEVLPHAECVGIFRHPLLTAKSLERRNRFPTEFSLELWRRYNERLLAIHSRSPFPILRFDVDVAGFRAGLDRVISQLGLSVERRGDFFEDGLRHNEVSEEAALPAAVADVYARLCEVSA